MHLSIAILFFLQAVYQWMVKPNSIVKTNEMFLPGRMAFIFNMVRLQFFSYDMLDTSTTAKKFRCLFV